MFHRFREGQRVLFTESTSPNSAWKVPFVVAEALAARDGEPWYLLARGEQLVAGPEHRLSSCPANRMMVEPDDTPTVPVASALRRRTLCDRADGRREQRAGVDS